MSKATLKRYGIIGFVAILAVAAANRVPKVSSLMNNK